MNFLDFDIRSLARSILASTQGDRASQNERKFRII
jgi:hypothetical protein